MLVAVTLGTTQQIKKLLFLEYDRLNVQSQV